MYMSIYTKGEKYHLCKLSLFDCTLVGVTKSVVHSGTVTEVLRYFAA